jgi:hypothetical protein
MASLKIYSNYHKLLRQLSKKGMIKSLNLAHDQEKGMNYIAMMVGDDMKVCSKL